jgi:hypothetical protein
VADQGPDQTRRSTLPGQCVGKDRLSFVRTLSGEEDGDEILKAQGRGSEEITTLDHREPEEIERHREERR